MINSRQTYIDLVKIVAIFFVIVNHTNSYVFLSIHPSLTWFVSLTYFFVSKVAVPLFIMSTGALLLGGVDSYSKHFNRFKRIFIIFIIASSFYYYINFIIPVGYKGFLSSLSDVIQRPSSNALWYLYLYLSLIIVMPYLQRLCNSFNVRDMYYFISLCFLFSTAYLLLKNYGGVSVYRGFDVSVFTYPIGYLFAGHLIHRYAQENKLLFIWSILIFILTLVFSVIVTYLNYHPESSKFLFWSNIGLPNIAAMSVSGFYIIKYISKFLVSRKLEKAITSISACTFGIYLASDFILIKTQPYFIYLSNIIKPFLSCLVWQFSILIISLVLIRIFRCIPLVRHYL